MRRTPYIAGQGMYCITGEDQSTLTIPVVEVFQAVTAQHQLIDRVAEAPNGLAVRIWPETNQWKVTNETSGFHITVMAIHCAMEMAIVIVAGLRLFRWNGPLLSIGPVCLILLIVSAVVRFAETFLDPALTYRVIAPCELAASLVIAHAPFFFSSGILLCFYWAECLKSSKVKATPFISDYKWPAIIVIATLFIAQIVCSALWQIVGAHNFNPLTIVLALYTIVSVVLTVCYIICSVNVYRRLQSKSVQRAAETIKTAFRFALSTSGYVIFAICIILQYPFSGIPWPYKILINIAVFGMNLASILQVTGYSNPSNSASRGATAISTSKYAEPLSLSNTSITP